MPSKASGALKAEMLAWCHRSKLGADHPDTLRSVLHFAAVLQSKKRFQEAEDLCQEVHDRFQQAQ